MNLAQEVKKYIKHKVILANVKKVNPHYMYIPRLNALQFCDSLMRLFCYQAQNLTQYDIARYVLQNKQHLEMILPNPNNKSYESSFKKYHEIIDFSNEILKPKVK